MVWWKRGRMGELKCLVQQSGSCMTAIGRTNVNLKNTSCFHEESKIQQLQFNIGSVLREVIRMLWKKK